MIINITLSFIMSLLFGIGIAGGIVRWIELGFEIFSDIKEKIKKNKEEKKDQ